MQVTMYPSQALVPHRLSATAIMHTATTWLVVSGSLTVESLPGSDGSLITYGTVTGNATVQRYLLALTVTGMYLNP